jgi:RNA polymerase sigma factor (sigma-70 family)
MTTGSDRPANQPGNGGSTGGSDRVGLEVFQRLRPRLMGLAYRILGSVADAEDALQDAWMRWDRVDLAELDNPEAYLTTVVGRVSLDHLRRVQARRETYPGPWLPEPVGSRPDPDRDPEAAVELADSLSMALLVVLETLSPLERAAFVLREVFDRPYPRSLPPSVAARRRCGSWSTVPAAGSTRATPATAPMRALRSGWWRSSWPPVAPRRSTGWWRCWPPTS